MMFRSGGVLLFMSLLFISAFVCSLIALLSSLTSGVCGLFICQVLSMATHLS
jgi:hypothetical protein